MPYTPDWGVPPPRHYGTSPGPGRGSESSRAQHPAPQGTPRRQHPPRGLVGALGGLGGSQGSGGEGRAGVLRDGGAVGAAQGGQGAVRVGCDECCRGRGAEKGRGWGALRRMGRDGAGGIRERRGGSGNGAFNHLRPARANRKRKKLPPRPEKLRHGQAGLGSV